MSSPWLSVSKEGNAGLEKGSDFPNRREQVLRIIMMLVRANLDQAQTLFLGLFKALCGILTLPEVASVSMFHRSKDQSLHVS